ncbi:hypothetical protein SeMB42_g06906 [Synchytrium endobioticum]|uniref:Chromo domain-containing protein n=1 Tax=Synchytrium endobioticum TaxID=286115 RepID=A0A507CD16_9FUNG|nr:hypothetical protein SeMB42_g06906 [Synchytrium endobioticum]
MINHVPHSVIRVNYPGSSPRRRWEWLVHWADSESGDDTWELATFFEDCEDLLSKFYRGTGLKSPKPSDLETSIYENLQPIRTHMMAADYMVNIARGYPAGEPTVLDSSYSPFCLSRWACYFVIPFHNGYQDREVITSSSPVGSLIMSLLEITHPHVGRKDGAIEKSRPGGTWDANR